MTFDKVPDSEMAQMKQRRASNKNSVLTIASSLMNYQPTELMQKAKLLKSSREISRNLKQNSFNLFLFLIHCFNIFFLNCNQNETYRRVPIHFMNDGNNQMSQ
jgi:hypothetical protein